MKTALTHDFILKHDAEFLILEEFAKVIKEADLLTLHYRENALSTRLKELTIYEAKSSLSEMEDYQNEIPKILKELAKFPFSRYQVIVSTSSGPMRWVKQNRLVEQGEGPFQIAYVVNPFPGLWDFSQKTQQNERLAENRELDKKFAQGIDFCLTGSQRMQKILNEIYGIDSEIVAPPVSGSIFYPRPGFAEYFVAETTFLPGYNSELFFETFNYLKEKLILCAKGNPEKISSQIEKNILITTQYTDIQRANYLSNAIAVIVTDENHHNHLAFEGLRMGKPVICHKNSTVAEYMKHGEDGYIFENNTVDDLMQAIFTVLEEKFDSEKISRKFSFLSRTRFRSEIAEILSKKTPLSHGFLRF